MLSTVDSCARKQIDPCPALSPGMGLLRWNGKVTEAPNLSTGAMRLPLPGRVFSAFGFGLTGAPYFAIFSQDAGCAAIKTTPTEKDRSA